VRILSHYGFVLYAFRMSCPDKYTEQADIQK